MPLCLVVRKSEVSFFPSLEDLSEGKEDDNENEAVFCKPILSLSGNREELAEFEGFLKVLLGLDMFFNGIHQLLEEVLAVGRETGQSVLKTG